MQIVKRIGKTACVVGVMALPLMASAFGGVSPPIIIVVAPSYDNTSPLKGVMTPEEAWNLDTKLDDGSPMTGDLVVSSAGATTATSCTDAPNTNATSGKYLVSSTSKDCALISRNAF